MESLQDIISLMKAHHNIDLSVYDETFLVKTLESRLLNTQSVNLKDYCKYLDGNDLEANELKNCLNVSYSEFFRNPLTYAYLETIILPRLFAEKKEVRIWSVACAAGQEPYSIAIICDEICENINLKTSFRIFASDINPIELEKARLGIYSDLCLGNVPLKRINRYFNFINDKYHISNDLKSKIDFSVFDLLKNANIYPPSSIFGNFDVVLCNNILFYYRPEYQETILKKIYSSLAKGGYLITGETEREIISEKYYHKTFKKELIFQKRNIITN